MAVRQHPGVETPGYCRVVPLGRHVAEDEAASGAPGRFAFRQRANVAQAFGHDAAGGGHIFKICVEAV